MAYRPSAGRNQTSLSAPRVPNLIPVMNLFLTIIPFLILMLVISQVALVAFNFSDGAAGGVGSAGGGLANKELQEITVIIMASQDSSRSTYPGFEVRLNPAGEDAGPYPLPVFSTMDKDGKISTYYDYQKLDLTLKNLKNEHPDLLDISVAPYPDVRYETLMRTIDICKSDDFQNVHYKAPQTMYIGGESKK